MCLGKWLLLFTVVNFVGTSLQEIKVDCDIDDRASIAITKKGKVWEVSQWNRGKEIPTCDVVGKTLCNYLDSLFELPYELSYCLLLL